MRIGVLHTVLKDKSEAFAKSLHIRDILPQLVRQDVLTQEDRKQINGKQTEECQTVELLDILNTKSESKLEKFLVILGDDGPENGTNKELYNICKHGQEMYEAARQHSPISNDDGGMETRFQNYY